MCQTTELIGAVAWPNNSRAHWASGAPGRGAARRFEQRCGDALCKTQKTATCESCEPCELWFWGVSPVWRSLVCGVVMSCLKILKHFETPKPLLKHHFPAFFYRFSSFSYETFYDSFCRQSDSSSIPGPVILHLAWCMATWHQVVKIGCFRDDKQLFHETIKMCVESGKSNAKNHPHWLPTLPEMHRHKPSTIGDLWHWVYAISIHFHQNLMWWDM